MTQRQHAPCRFRRHDFANGACMIELMRDGRTFGVIRRGSFDKPFGFTKPEVVRPLSTTFDDDLVQCLRRNGRH